jgi:hypothetical protein
MYWRLFTVFALHKFFILEVTRWVSRYRLMSERFEYETPMRQQNEKLFGMTPDVCEMCRVPHW